MLSLFVLALSLGLGASILQESAFTGKREYVYKYMAQTVFGLPGTSKIYSGVKIVANTRLQFLTTTEVVAMLENIELYTMNDAVVHRNPIREQIDPAFMTRFYNPLIIKKLAMPFTFRYVNGHVVSLKTPEFEPYWSVNIKRGIISLMEVNLNQRFTPVRNLPHAPFYSAYEMSASGFCRSIYTVEEPEFNYEVPANTMVVSKTRDFKHCTIRPAWYKTMIKPRFCEQCSPEKAIGLSEGAQVRYTLKGTRERFIILSAIGESFVSFHPYQADQGHMATIINQTLFLVDAFDMHDTTIVEWMQTANMVERFASTFVPEFVVDNIFPFYEQTAIPMPMDEIRFADKMKIIKVLKTVAESITTPEVLKTATRFPIMAVSLMRGANETTLIEIWRDYAIPKPTETEIDVAMRKTVWHCMAATGTFISGKIILETCLAKEIPATTCAGLINMVSLANEANSIFIEKLITVTTQLGDGEEPQLVRALWLAIGTITNKLKYAELYEMKDVTAAIPIITQILQHERDPVARQEMTVLKTHTLNKHMVLTKMYTEMHMRIVALIKAQLSKAGIEPKIMALKAAGNAGLPELIPVCAAVITDYKQPEFIRFTAVWAMMKMAQWDPVMVRGILIPVLMKTTDTAAVRIAAFTAVVGTKPPRVVLEMLARHIAREPDLQVAAYMYSAFVADATLTHPCFTHMAKEAGRLVQLAPRVEPGMYYSTIKIWEARCPNVRIPGSIVTQLGIIGSKSSLFPKSVSFDLYGHIFGKTTPIVQIGLYTEELRTALDKLFGPNGVLTNRKSILDIISPRMKRSLDSEAKIEDIVKKINLNLRQMPVPTGSLYMKVFGYEMRYFTLDEALQTLATSGKIATMFKEEGAGIAVPIDYAVPLFLGDINIILPTEAGIPVHMMLAATTAVKVKGMASVKVTPALFESRRQSPPVEAKALFDLRMSAVVEVRGQMYINVFRTIAGAAVVIRTKIAAPIIGNITANLPRRKIITAIVPPIQEEPIIEVETFPMTFQYITPVNQVNEIEVAEGGRIVENIVEFGDNTIGMNMVLRTKLASRYGNPWAAILPFTGRSMVQFFVKPGPSPPQAVVIQAQFATGTPVKPTGGINSAAGSSCDCPMGRLTFCLVACAEEDVTDPEMVESVSSLEDFPNLIVKDVSIGELKAKLQAKLGASVRLSPVGHKWGMIATIDASTPAIPRKLQFEALWQSVNKNEMHQFVFRFARTALPTYPQPWELITTAMLQYPTRVITARNLLDPRYHTQVQQNLQYMTRFMSHRPILSHLNATAITMLKEHMQNIVGTPNSPYLLRSLAYTFFARYNDTMTASLIPIWRKLIILGDRVQSIWHQAVDPIFIVKHVESLTTQIAELEKVQMMLIPMLKITPFQTEVPFLTESCLLEHYRILTTLADVCYRASKMTIIPHSETLYAKVVQLMTALHEAIIADAANLARLPALPATADITLRKLWPRLERISATQINTLKHLIMAIKTTSVPSLQPIVDVVGMVRETLPIVTETLRTVSLVDLHATTVLTKIATEHSMIIEALKLVVDRLAVSRPADEAQYVHLLQALKAQTASVSFVSAVLVKFRYELITLAPILTERDLVMVKKLQVIQMNLGLEIARVIHITSFTPYTLSLEAPEQIFTAAEEIIRFTETMIPKIVYVLDELHNSNVEPNIFIFEKTTMTVLYMRTIVKKLKTFIVANIIATPEVARCVAVLRKCETIMIVVEELEIKATKAFERIWNTASQHETSMATPVTEEMVGATLSAVILKQKEVQMQVIGYVREIKRVPTTTIQPWIDTLLDTCRGLQTRIDWIQLWGIPLGRFSPIFAHVISMQQEILKKVREVVTVCEMHLETPEAVNFIIQDLEAELSRVVKIGSVEMTGIIPDAELHIPTITKTPMMPNMPYIPNMPNMPFVPNTPFKAYTPNMPSIPSMQNVGNVPFTPFVAGIPNMPNMQIPKIPMMHIPIIPINPVTKMESTYFPLAFTGFVNITFGPIGIAPKTIIMKMYGSKSFEQLMWESSQLNPIGRDRNVEIAIARQEAGVAYGITENPIYRWINTLNHRHITIKYTPFTVPAPVKFTLMNWISTLVAPHIWDTTVSAPVETRPGVMHIINDVKMNSPASDTYLMTSNMTVSMLGVNTILAKVTAYNPLLAPWITEKIQMAPVMGPYFPPECKVNFDNVRTFDGVEYTVPDVGTCPMVLAMDCSPRKEFAITMRTVTGMSAWKRSAMDMTPNVEPMTEMLYAKKKIIEIYAEGKVITVAATTTGATISVDGEPITITPAAPYIVEKTVSYGERAVAVKITVARGYLIELPLVGLYIFSTGNYVNVKASTVFKMKTCGLCSNMDGQQRYEFESADGRVFYTPERFVASYVIRGPTCPAPAFHNVGGAGKIVPAPAANVAAGSACAPVPIHVIKYKRTERQICFSMVPVPRCPSECQAADVTKNRIKFICLPADNAEARTIRKQIKAGQRPDLSKKTPNAEFTIMQHVACK